MTINQYKDYKVKESLQDMTNTENMLAEYWWIFYIIINNLNNLIFKNSAGLNKVRETGLEPAKGLTQ